MCLLKYISIKVKNCVWYITCTRINTTGILLDNHFTDSIVNVIHMAL